MQTNVHNQTTGATDAAYWEVPVVLGKVMFGMGVVMVFNGVVMIVSQLIFVIDKGV